MPIANPDTLALERMYQPLSYRIHYWTGINTFCIALITWAMCITAFMLGTKGGETMVIIILVFIELAWLLVSLMIAQHWDYVASKPGYQNPLKRHWHLRLGVLIMHLLVMSSHLLAGWDTVSFLLDVLAGVLFVSTFYFMSCDLMPSGWSPPQRFDKLARVRI